VKLSVFHHHLAEAATQTGLPVVEIAKTVRALGVTAVDCSLEQTTESDFETVLMEADLVVASIYTFFDFGAAPEPDQSERLIERASSLGASLVLAIPGFVSRDASHVERQAARSNMATGLRALCDRGEQNNIRVCLEDFDDERAPFSTVEGLLWFLDQVPSLRCTFDTGNFAYSEEDELLAFHELSSRIVHVHCKDRTLLASANGTPKYSLNGRPLYSSPVGSGFIKMAEIVDALQAANYNGYYAIEHFGAPDQLSYIRSSVEWLRSRAGSADS
jgi:L-ribulose-5-phosphate 3-epimerase